MKAPTQKAHDASSKSEASMTQDEAGSRIFALRRKLQPPTLREELQAEGHTDAEIDHIINIT